MKKQIFFVACLMLSSLLLCACNSAPNSTIKYERKFGKYFHNEKQPAIENSVDLSEGPRLKYNADFGPRDLNFDIKIINPY